MLIKLLLASLQVLIPLLILSQLRDVALFHLLILLVLLRKNVLVLGVAVRQVRGWVVELMVELFIQFKSALAWTVVIFFYFVGIQGRLCSQFLCYLGSLMANSLIILPNQIVQGIPRGSIDAVQECQQPLKHLEYERGRKVEGSARSVKVEAIRGPFLRSFYENKLNIILSLQIWSVIQLKEYNRRSENIFICSLQVIAIQMSNYFRRAYFQNQLRRSITVYKQKGQALKVISLPQCQVKYFFKMKFASIFLISPITLLIIWMEIFLNPRQLLFKNFLQLDQKVFQIKILSFLMSENHMIPEGDQKLLDSTSALEKVLRLDKKHTNFDYLDPIRSITLKINYPQMVSEGPSSETLLKSLWKHANNYYFKKIEECEYERLKYIQRVINSKSEGKATRMKGFHRFASDEEFWTLIHETFSQKYLQRYLLSERDKLDYHNWLEYLNLTWQVITTTDLKALKKNQGAYDILKSNLRAIYKLDQVTLHYKLKLERVELAKFLEDQNDEGSDQVSDEIRRLQSQLKQNSAEMGWIFERLKEKVEYQATVQDIVFCENGDEEVELRSSESQRMERKIEKLNSFQVQTKYIEYIIQILQKKQIAQSISKLYRIEKQKGQVRIHLHFQDSMGIKPIVVSEKQFIEINQLREYSLLKYYNTASKTKYSFICQNVHVDLCQYLGFKDIHQNRSKPCKYKNKDILQQMKKSSIDSIQSNYYKEFNRMEICHHCKLLHHQDNLVTCEYHSSKYGNPIPPSPYYDSYVYQILKNEQSRVSAIRFLNSSEARRNSYFFYNKQNDQYICGRKYCKYCLKNYDDGKQKSNGLCPYCRGICYCTRCSRNDMMVRLKSMYILMGGDISHLQKSSIFERYYQNIDDQMDLRRKDKTGKTPRKNFIVPNRMNQKMLNIRFQLEDLRILCDLVKRREKNKQKLATCQKDIFRKKVLQINGEFYDKKIEKNVSNEMEDSEEQNKKESIKLSEKLSKKLKRMIS